MDSWMNIIDLLKSKVYFMYKIGFEELLRYTELSSQIELMISTSVA